MSTGLASQQVTKDPGGQRWLRLTDDAVALLLTRAPHRDRSETDGHGRGG